MVNVREVFWSMVRNPELLINYVRELGLDIKDLCGDEVGRFRCPPGQGDDFRSRFFVISYLYLKLLSQEVRELGGYNVPIEGVRELVSDIITDMRLYNAPPELFDAIIKLVRELLRLLPDVA
ncbi:MAG: hypothetical protein L7G96_03750 [Vulcanisaeta sp.]|nr:hypothetical protein [Vulcanisaeta sp.]MCG2895324.1 hypothetical protein [Vulcanisaeta sp.]